MEKLWASFGNQNGDNHGNVGEGIDWTWENGGGEHSNDREKLMEGETKNKQGNWGKKVLMEAMNIPLRKMNGIRITTPSFMLLFKESLFLRVG